MHLKTVIKYGNGFKDKTVILNNPIDLFHMEEKEIIELIDKNNPIKNSYTLHDTYWKHGTNRYETAYYSEGKVDSLVSVEIETVLEIDGRYFSLNELKFYKPKKVD